MKKTFFSIQIIIIGALILFISILIISPDAKAFVTNSLYSTGLIKCNIAEAKPAVETPSATATGEREMAAPEAPLAPSVVFKDGNGNTVDIAKQQGKVLFINFWATWCPPCIAEMPSINKLKSGLSSSDIVFLMVDVDNNYRKSKKFMDSNKFNLTVYSPVSTIPASLLSGAIPTTVIIDKAGKVVGRHEGAADYASPEAVKYFKALINQ